MKARERWIALIVVVGALGLCALAMEGAFRLIDKPAAIISGWRGTQAPLNEFGWRGRPITYAPDDFVVVLVGDSQVECKICPADETMDVILERALRRHIPKVRVVTLGAAGHGTDQEFLALREYFARYRADLVIAWVTIYNDIVNNLTRSAGGGYHRFHPKPSFWLENGELRGPTEEIDAAVFTGKLRILWHRAFEDFERGWAARLPPPDHGTAQPPTSMDRVIRTVEAVEEQRSTWSILQTPRPARISHGIALTRALLDRMRTLSESKNATFAVMIEDSLSPASAEQALRLGWEMFAPGKAAVVHDNHWIVADADTYHATVQDVTAGFEFLSVPVRTANARISPVDNHFLMPANRQVMGDLADMLAERPQLIARGQSARR